MHHFSATHNEKNTHGAADMHQRDHSAEGLVDGKQ